MRIPRPIFDEMVGALTAVYPQEGCGLLSGVGRTITHHYPIENIHHSPTKYELNPQQQIEVFTDAEERGELILAVYHSHPHGPERPSATDIAQAHYPEFVYIICSLKNQDAPVVRGFTIIDQVVTDIHLQIV